MVEQMCADVSLKVFHAFLKSEKKKEKHEEGTDGGVLHDGGNGNMRLHAQQGHK